MNRKSAFAVVMAALLLAGCITHYRYLSLGEIAAADGTERRAVIYWGKDEGHLWYGRPYEQTDSTIVMRICNRPDHSLEFFPLEFVTAGRDHVELHARSGDERIALADPRGELLMLTEEQYQVLRPPDYCGFIFADESAAGVADLEQGVRPRVLLLCRNETSPGRYPIAGEYVFSEVSREKAGGELTPPDACL